MDRPETPERRLRLSGSEVRRLLQLRETIKVASLTIPTAVQRRVLEILERARPWRISPRAIPEMSRGELIRAIRWRLGTIPLAGVLAAAEFMAQYRRLRLRTPRGHATRTANRSRPGS